MLRNELRRDCGQNIARTSNEESDYFEWSEKIIATNDAIEPYGGSLFPLLTQVIIRDTR